jgi:hypothetical protein
VSDSQVSASDSSDATDASAESDTSVTVDVGSDVVAGNAIAGIAHGRPFDSVAASWWIGAPDSPGTVVVYLFSTPVTCAQISGGGWDATLAEGTQSLEMKLIGTQPANYAIVKTATPAPGEASVNQTLTTGGQGDELQASSGEVVLTQIKATTMAVGTFHVVLPSGGKLDGSFSAPFCKGGREP